MDLSQHQLYSCDARRIARFRSLGNPTRSESAFEMEMLIGSP